MTILGQVIDWVKDKDSFVQNVLFRILSKNHLSKQDLVDLEKLLIDIEYRQGEEKKLMAKSSKNLLKI